MRCRDSTHSARSDSANRLRHVYDKLGISRRVDLPEALDLTEL